MNRIVMTGAAPPSPPNRESQKPTSTVKRLIVLDTETTGLSPDEGHRVVEIGCVELLSRKVGANRQWYINPERDIPREATAIHGITDDKVKECPVFAQIVQEFLDFIGDAPFVIHNAAFDMRFLNAELARLGLTRFPAERAIDTLAMARRQFSGGSNSLDALCKRLGVDNSRRTFHGALMDAHLLAEVYIALTGGNQYRLELPKEIAEEKKVPVPVVPLSERRLIAPRSWPLSPEEETLHADYLQFLHKESGNCVWLQ